MKKLFLLIGLVVFLTPSLSYSLDDGFNLDLLIDDLKVEVEKERNEKEKKLFKIKQIEEKKKEEYLKEQQRLFEIKQLEEKQKKTTTATTICFNRPKKYRRN